MSDVKDKKPADQIIELKRQIDAREEGRIYSMNVLTAIAEESVSHADAVRMARDLLFKAGQFYRDNPNLTDDERANMPEYVEYNPPLGTVRKEYL